MSRVRRNSTGRPRIALAVLGLGAVVALGAAGCSAGQITQTDTQLPAVNGGMGQAGAIALRNIQLVYPQGGTYPQGGKVAVIGTIANGGQFDDELLSVNSPVAASAIIEGDRRLSAGRTLVAEKGIEISSTTASAHPSRTVQLTESPAPSASASSAPQPSESGVPSPPSVPPSSLSRLPVLRVPLLRVLLRRVLLLRFLLRRFRPPRP